MKKENPVILYPNSGIYYRPVFEKGCNNINIRLSKRIFSIKRGWDGGKLLQFKVDCINFTSQDCTFFTKKEILRYL